MYARNTTYIKAFSIIARMIQQWIPCVNFCYAIQYLDYSSYFTLSRNLSLFFVFEKYDIFRDVTSGRQYCEVPLEDRHIALNLLLELALQKGTLTSILDAVMLLLNLWEKETHLDNNRYSFLEIINSYFVFLIYYYKLSLMVVCLYLHNIYKWYCFYYFKFN